MNQRIKYLRDLNLRNYSNRSEIIYSFLLKEFKLKKYFLDINLFYLFRLFKNELIINLKFLIKIDKLSITYTNVRRARFFSKIFNSCFG